jgi:predicted peptidase
MNVLLLSLLAWEIAAVPENTVAQFEEHTQKYTGGDYKDEVFQYRLLKPATIKSGEKYPIVLFLHGAGERGDDNKNQLQYLPELMAREDYRQKFPCFLIAPQCRNGKKWVEVDWSSLTTEMPKEAGDQMKVVLQILDDVLKNYPVDKSRIYLTGLSMGGYGSWDLSMRYPERFAAVVPICGGGDESHADRLIKVPVWAVHGDQDKAVPVARSRNMIEAIKKAGGQPKYTEMPGVGHNSWTPAYTDPTGVVPWMFEQRLKDGAK